MTKTHPLSRNETRHKNQNQNFKNNNTFNHLRANEHMQNFMTGMSHKRGDNTIPPMNYTTEHSWK